MTKDLEQFENRSDDWLAKERKYESKISAWDFDEGTKIKKYHESNCEAKQIKERHEMIHQRKIKLQDKNASPIFGFVIVFIIGINILQSIFLEDKMMPLPILFIIITVMCLTFISTKQRRK